MNELTHEEIAEKLLYPMWRCVPADYKERYRADAWTHFENFVRSAAAKKDLKQFFEQFKRTMPFEWQQQFSKPVLGIINCGRDREALGMIRSECAYLILLVRQLNEDVKSSLRRQREYVTIEEETGPGSLFLTDITDDETENYNSKT